MGADLTNYNDLGLTPNTSYTYRVYAYNSAGNSIQYSNEVSVTTSSVPVLTTTTVGSITTSTATSGGDIINDGGTPILSRGVVWSTSNNPTIALSTKTVDGSGSGNFSSNLTGLSPNTNYYVRAYATNANGTAYGNEVSFTTLNVDLVTGLVGYWPFNGNANDESGNGNNGRVYGASLTTDRFGNVGKAYSFDGSSNYIDCRIMSNLGNYPNSLTENVWILAATNQSIYCKMPVISKRHSGMNSWATLGAGGNGTVGVPWNNQAYFFVNAPNYGDGITNAVFSNSLTNDNVWHMLTGVKSGNNYKIYFDGVLQDSTTDNYPNLGSTDNMLFGHESIWGFSCEQWYEGKLDDIRIYNRALSQSEITYLATH
jgi:hypothetical protein